MDKDDEEDKTEWEIENEDDATDLLEASVLEEVTNTKYFFENCLNTFTMLVSLFLIIYLSLYIANLAMIIEQTNFNPISAILNAVYPKPVVTEPQNTAGQSAVPCIRNSTVNVNTYCQNAIKT